MKNFIGFIARGLGGFFDGYGDGLLTLFSAGVLFKISDMMENTIPIANFLVSWGMVIIVGYGVLRITLNLLWNILFGKNFHWKIGILERLVSRLRPVRAQTIAEATDEEIEEKALHYMRRLRKVRIMKKKHGGVRHMGFKDVMHKVNANKWTILGVGSIAGTAVLAATGVINPSAVEDVANIVNGMPVADAAEGLIAAVTLGAGAVLGIKAAIGKGVESTEEFDARKAAEAQEKAEQAQLKASGVLQAQQATQKLVKKLHIPEAKAKEIVAMQLESKQEVIQAQLEAERQKKVQKLAKKLHISEAKAAEIVKEME